MPRQTLGRYQIQLELGRGAMGVVMRALDSVIGRVVAIKTIRLDNFPDPVEREKLKARFLREARSAGLLSHPNIVTVYDVGEEDGIAFIAMEYVPGQTVDQALRESGRLDRGRIVTVVTQVAAALDYAHGQGVVHRDIKPGNLMLAAAGVKITDFGVAKLLSHQATQSDMMLGTPNYMAPEQIDARGVDGRTDQFALAVIAYELLTGERPFHAETLASLLYRILREDPTPPHLLNPTLNERVSAMLLRGLSKAPADRFANCAAFATALTASLAGCRDWQPLSRAAASTMATVAEPAATRPLPKPPSFAVEASPPASGRRRWGLIAAVAMVALAAVPVFQWLYPAQPEPAPTRAAADETRPSAVASASSEPIETATAAAPPSSTVTAIPAPPPVPLAKPTVPQPQPGPVSGLVEIESNPPGATVGIDATRDQCKTPCSIELSQGRHVLRFQLAGHRNGTLVITVPQEASAVMRLEPLIGSLLVHTTPPGAEILVNGQPRKEKSPATLRLAPGKYKLTLRREGAREYSQEVEVRDEAITQVEFAWPPAP